MQSVAITLGQILEPDAPRLKKRLTLAYPLTQRSRLEPVDDLVAQFEQRCIPTRALLQLGLRFRQQILCAGKLAVALLQTLRCLTGHPRPLVECRLHCFESTRQFRMGGRQLVQLLAEPLGLRLRALPSRPRGPQLILDALKLCVDAILRFLCFGLCLKRFLLLRCELLLQLLCLLTQSAQLFCLPGFLLSKGSRGEAHQNRQCDRASHGQNLTPRSTMKVSTLNFWPVSRMLFWAYVIESMFSAENQRMPTVVSRYSA